MESSLIAPCGMYCALCSGYCAFINGVPRKRGKIAHCAGCRARNKQCAYLKGRCRPLAEGRIRYCFECKKFPCERLQHLDRRYRTRYDMSFIQNLIEIRDTGEAVLLRRLHKRFACERCGGLRSIHNNKCFACDPVTSWKE